MIKIIKLFIFLLSFSSYADHSKIELSSPEEILGFNDKEKDYEKLRVEIKGFKFPSIDEICGVYGYSLKSLNVYELPIKKIECILKAKKSTFEKIKILSEKAKNNDYDDGFVPPTDDKNFELDFLDPYLIGLFKPLVFHVGKKTIKERRNEVSKKLVYEQTKKMALSKEKAITKKRQSEFFLIERFNFDSKQGGCLESNDDEQYKCIKLLLKKDANKINELFRKLEGKFSFKELDDGQTELSYYIPVSCSCKSGTDKIFNTFVERMYSQFVFYDGYIQNEMEQKSALENSLNNEDLIFE